MKIKPNANLQNFLKDVHCCRGSVFYRTEEGDKINLKSQLSQYLMVMAFHDEELSIDGSIVCTNEGDRKHLAGYLYE